MPKKLPMVEACKVTQDGNYVTMIVADQGPEILETFYGYIKIKSSDYTGGRSSPVFCVIKLLTGILLWYNQN